MTAADRQPPPSIHTHYPLYANNLHTVTRRRKRSRRRLLVLSVRCPWRGVGGTRIMGDRHHAATGASSGIRITTPPARNKVIHGRNLIHYYCCSTTSCFAKNDGYAECLPSCPDDWTCAVTCLHTHAAARTPPLVPVRPLDIYFFALGFTTVY